MIALRRNMKNMQNGSQENTEGWKVGLGLGLRINICYREIAMSNE